MKEIFDILQKNYLFHGITYSEFCSIYKCLNCQIQTFNKKDIILTAGDSMSYVGIVLTGRVHLTREDINGNYTIITEVVPSEMFGETFACSGIPCIPINIIAPETCTILTIRLQQLLTVCSKTCFFHSKLIQNLLLTISRKNLFLNQKLDIISKKTIREKLLCYLEVASNGQRIFSIPYKREELAAYIAADRSAMCAELSKMQQDGIILYKKNTFELL